jgi:molecular chaperone Hsp33
MSRAKSVHPLDDRDLLQRFVFERARVRGELVRLDASWQEVLRRHAYPPALRAALGELMAACALLAATIKLEGGALVLQVQGGRPVTLLVVECQSDLTLRAAAKWEGDLDQPGPEATLRALTAGARCALTIDPGPGKQAYQSVVPLEGLTTADVLEHYMARSEQLETRFLLAADEGRAAGVLLQKLPETGGRPPRAEDGDLWDRTATLLHTLTREEILGCPGADILRRLFHQEDLRVFESIAVRFACRCSRERVGGVIRMIGADEARALLTERGEISVTCEFCNETYVFDHGQTEAALRGAAAHR